ncbi:MAG: HEAT repeat domain-containing protein, partial [Candidatus Hydrogenedentes bacterium]|nr:HEAT repeat domain-containing protein [Candidatus Hydrogenedentota bacterium]
MKFFLPVFLILLFIGGSGVAQDVILDPDIDSAAAGVQNDPVAQQALETECIASVSSSETPYPEFYRAIRILAIIGSDKCVMPLAALLNDADKAHFARVVLEAMPSEKAGKALRDALHNTTGQQRLGVISSLTFRRDVQAVDALKALLSDADSETVAGAANALGYIATPAAIEALRSLQVSNDEVMTWIAVKALLLAAGQVQGTVGVGIYKEFLSSEMPDFIRIGSFNGLIAADRKQALENILHAIQQEDELLQLTAIAALADLDDSAVIQRLGVLLPSLEGRFQALIINALAKRSDSAVLPLLHTVISTDNAEARLAAMRAIAVHGNESSIKPLCAIIEKTSVRQEKMAAIETLRRLQGDTIDTLLVQRMISAPEEMRVDLMDVLAQRNAVVAVDAIIAQIQYDSLRPAAFRALTHLMVPERLSDLLELLAGLQDDVGRLEAENAVVALCERVPYSGGQLQITKAVYGDLPDGQVKDVTSVIAKNVEGGTLSVLVGNSSFGDPAPGIEKKLQVEYVVNSVAVTKIVGENQKLLLQADALPKDLVDMLATRLKTANSNEEKVSLLRVLSRLGGTNSYQLVLGCLKDSESVIRDGAVRSLANWPDVEAAPQLASLFATASETAHRMVTLRGCVRLLRLGQMDQMVTLALYENLVGSARNADERKVILSGLADVNAPEAIPIVLALIEDDSVKTEATMALKRIGDATGMTEAEIQAAKKAAFSTDIPGSHSDFLPIFDGETLEGWSGEPVLWRVEDGCIIGETTAETLLKTNTFLTWEGG